MLYPSSEYGLQYLSLLFHARTLIVLAPYLPPPPSSHPPRSPPSPPSPNATTLKLSAIPGHYWSQVFDKLNIHLQELDIPSGACIKVQGDILSNAKVFSINLGKDAVNFGLHFNPRFNFCNCYGIIVCNTRTDGNWGTEQRQNDFPFVPGTTVTVEITFTEPRFTVRMHDGSILTFPNRLNYTKIDFLSVTGDFSVRKVQFE